MRLMQRIYEWSARRLGRPFADKDGWVYTSLEIKYTPRSTDPETCQHMSVASWTDKNGLVRVDCVDCRAVIYRTAPREPVSNG